MLRTLENYSHYFFLLYFALFILNNAIQVLENKRTERIQKGEHHTTEISQKAFYDIITQPETFHTAEWIAKMLECALARSI